MEVQPFQKCFRCKISLCCFRKCTYFIQKNKSELCVTVDGIGYINETQLFTKSMSLLQRARVLTRQPCAHAAMCTHTRIHVHTRTPVCVHAHVSTRPRRNGHLTFYRKRTLYNTKFRPLTSYTQIQVTRTVDCSWPNVTRV